MDIKVGNKFVRTHHLSIFPKGTIATVIKISGSTIILDYIDPKNGMFWTTSEQFLIGSGTYKRLDLNPSEEFLSSLY